MQAFIQIFPYLSFKPNLEMFNPSSVSVEGQTSEFQVTEVCFFKIFSVK